MKIGILTYHRSHNYGAYLQSYALCRTIQQITDCQVEIIDYNMEVAQKVNKEVINFNRRNPESLLYNYLKYRMFERNKERLPISEYSLVTDDMDKFREFIENNYDIVIVGSDEVWKVDGFRGFPNPYWLPQVTGIRKLSYAASSRTRYEDISPDNISKLKKYAADFEYIGVRDDATKKLLGQAINNSQKIYVNCDPTFLYDFNASADRGKKILKEKFHVDINKPVVGIMCGVPQLAKEIINANKDKCQFISLYYYYRHTNGFAVLDPFEWIDVIAALSGLITTFFHGMVFAIKEDTPFIVIENRALKDYSDSKNYDILLRNNLEDHFVCLSDKYNVVAETEKFVSKVISPGYTEDYKDVREHEISMFKTFKDTIVKMCE